VSTFSINVSFSVSLKSLISVFLMSSSSFFRSSDMTVVPVVVSVQVEVVVVSSVFVSTGLYQIRSLVIFEIVLMGGSTLAILFSS